MRDVSLRQKWIFWVSLAIVALLAAVPSWVLVEKAREYLALVWTFDQGALRQLKLSRIPHRDTEPLPEDEIRFVEFSLQAPKAKAVRLAGTFNGWDPSALALRKDPRGLWKTLVPLPLGKHQYLFEVDGAWTPDPKAPMADVDGREASVREVR